MTLVRISKGKGNKGIRQGKCKSRRHYQTNEWYFKKNGVPPHTVSCTMTPTFQHWVHIIKFLPHHPRTPAPSILVVGNLDGICVVYRIRLFPAIAQTQNQARKLPPLVPSVGTYLSRDIPIKISNLLTV